MHFDFLIWGSFVTDQLNLEDSMSCHQLVEWPTDAQFQIMEARGGKNFSERDLITNLKKVSPRLCSTTISEERRPARYADCHSSFNRASNLLYVPYDSTICRNALFNPGTFLLEWKIHKFSSN